MILSIDLIHFILFDKLHLEFQSGLTIMTGESGAGKSIILDALRIILGDNFSQGDIKHEQDSAEISACFDISHREDIQQRLKEYELLDEAETCCMIRRTLTRAGRSNLYINGRRVTVKQLREIGSLLVHIHGQHANHSLLKNEAQRELLDHFLQKPELLQDVKNLFQQWRDTQKQIDTLLQEKNNPQSQPQWLHFQLEDLIQLNLKENEVEECHATQRKLANAERIISQCQSIIVELEEDERTAILRKLHQYQQRITELLPVYPPLTAVATLIGEAEMLLQETCRELNNCLQEVDLDQEQLVHIEKRLTQIHDTARKHRVKPENLLALQKQLEEELIALNSRDSQLEKLAAAAKILLDQYMAAAEKLSHARAKSAQELSTAVTTWLQTLGMSGGKLTIQCQANAAQLTEHGIDQIHFLIATNPGVPEKPLSQIASGGEISRISLAIQVITQHVTCIPTLVFDEVDIGISGSTAESVGKVLRELSSQTQILTVTHLPQVAALGHHHLKIVKSHVDEKTSADIHLLSPEDRVSEIARLVSGSRITEQTLAHAKELLRV